MSQVRKLYNRVRLVKLYCRPVPIYIRELYSRVRDVYFSNLMWFLMKHNCSGRDSAAMSFNRTITENTIANNAVRDRMNKIYPHMQEDRKLYPIGLLYFADHGQEYLTWSDMHFRPHGLRDHGCYQYFDTTRHQISEIIYEN